MGILWTFILLSRYTLFVIVLNLGFSIYRVQFDESDV